jgi:hypothetical protein
MRCIVDGCRLQADEDSGICRSHSPRRPSLLRLLLQPLFDVLAEIFRR